MMALDVSWAEGSGVSVRGEFLRIAREDREFSSGYTSLGRFREGALVTEMTSL